MKTILKLLETLPEPYRTQAIANCKEIMKGVSKETLTEAIVVAFTWASTPEGDSYWRNLYEHYMSGGYTPLPEPIPLRVSTHTVGGVISVGSTVYTKSDPSRTPRTVIAHTPDGKMITVPSAVVEVVGVEEVENE